MTHIAHQLLVIRLFTNTYQRLLAIDCSFDIRNVWRKCFHQPTSIFICNSDIHIQNFPNRIEKTRQKLAGLNSVDSLPKNKRYKSEKGVIKRQA